MNDDDFAEFVQKTGRIQKEAVQHTAAHGSYGERLTAQAALNATEWAKQDGLHPSWDVTARDWRYKVRQGLRAACVGREDAAVAVILSSTLLDNQLVIKRLLLVAIALLAYIAWRLQ